MATLKPFIFSLLFSIIFSVFFSFLFIRIAVDNPHQQLSSSLRIELDLLKSKVSFLVENCSSGFELRSPTAFEAAILGILESSQLPHDHNCSDISSMFSQLYLSNTLSKCSIEISNHELRSKEDCIAQMKKIILEKEESIASLKNKIDSVQQNASVDAKDQKNAPRSQAAELEKQVQEINSEQNPRIHKTEQALKVEEEVMMKAKLEVNLEECVEEYQGWLPRWVVVNLNDFQSFILAQWNNSGRPALNASFQKILKKMSQVLGDVDMCIEMVKTEWIPVLKNQMLTYISFFKPHFEYLTAETIEAYHVSKNSLLSHVFKLQRSATPFIQEWIPVMKNQLFTFTYSPKPHFEFLAAETIEAYQASKNSLLSQVVKLQRSATPFMQELHKFAQPHINQIATVTELCLDKTLVTLGALTKKMSMFLQELWKNG